MRSRKAKEITKRILFPPAILVVLLTLISAAALFVIFHKGFDDSVTAIPFYALAFYSLVIICVRLPAVVSAVKAKIFAIPAAKVYFSDPLLRVKLGILFGMLMNFLYVVFRAATGIYYRSAWFISMAVYHLLLGVTRAMIVRGKADGITKYKRTALILFVINIPMGGMIAQMVYANNGFSYPGYVIYLSAAYTFWSFYKAVSWLVKLRNSGDLSLSAAKVIDFIAAMMSVLGLQTAMIGQFSPDDEAYRRLMNTITGSAIYVFVILIAIFMLLKCRRLKSVSKR